MKKILERIEVRDYRVGIFGLGYVGLPLLLSFHNRGLKVAGFDIDKNKVSSLEGGRSYIKHVDAKQVQKVSSSEKAWFTTDFSRVGEVDAIIICVPTPLDPYRKPDMKYVEQTAMSVAPYLKKGQFISLESTTWPGTTEELLIPILEKGSGLIAGKDFYVAYSPEREDPGNPDFDTTSIPKIVGGLDGNSTELAVQLYRKAITNIVPVSGTRVAEAAKLLENIFRSVNIALVNEMKVILDAMAIDVHEVIEAAATKPFGFMKFTPGPGLGGHCIPIDPFYLSWKASEYGLNTKFIELAGEINTKMPEYVVNKVSKALNTQRKAVNGSSILVIGIAYKPDVDDMRESPSFTIMDELVEMGAKVSFYDTWIPKIPGSREHGNWEGFESVSWNKETVSGFDAVVIVTNHSDVNYSELADWNNCIIDSRNAMKGQSTRNEYHIFKA